MSDPLNDLFWKDEILQIAFWYLGENLGPSVSAADLRPFLAADPSLVQTQLARLAAGGYLADEGDGRYTLTELGRREGGRRFADEFDGLTRQAHGECNDPNCACKTQGPEACEARQHEHAHQGADPPTRHHRRWRARGGGMRRILIAGMGNVLQRDDGFGVETARQLASRDGLPAGVKVVEVGIGGIHLVQELMEGYDALVLMDAVERGSPPGSVHLLEAEVPELAAWSEDERRDFLADMHYATPSKALILARALGVLPPKVLILGCQPEIYEELGIGLSEAVAPAVASATECVLQVVEELRSG